jgi:hypothetical protein
MKHDRVKIAEAVGVAEEDDEAVGVVVIVVGDCRLVVE